MANSQQGHQVSVPRSVFGLRNIMIAAGVAVVLPYVLHRLLPLLGRGVGNITGNDVVLAGKDGVRDAADEFNVGGIGGTLKRAAGRVADHVRTDI